MALDPNNGTFSARIATLAPVCDKDGDVTLPGALPDGRTVLVSPWAHSSVASDDQPVGLATLRSDSTAAYADGIFFSTTAGQEARKMLAEAGGVVQWSYAYGILDASYDPLELLRYPGAKRILKRLDVYEITPCIIGAGEGTATLTAKQNRELSDSDMIAMFANLRRQIANSPEQAELRSIARRWA